MVYLDRRKHHNSFLIFAVRGNEYMVLAKRPVIGITPWYNEQDSMTYIKRGYMEAVYAAGGYPVLLPIIEDKHIWEKSLELCDGILLSGGEDVDPVHYGEESRDYNGNINPHRDCMEIWLCQMCFKSLKPVFGICRGIQVMNVAAGGSLYQDIPCEIMPEKLVKHSQKAPGWYPTHYVTLTEGSFIWQSFSDYLNIDEKGVRVNSFHHQCIKQPAQGFECTAVSNDGIIEAIEKKGHPFAVGVQWHPEIMWQKDKKYLEIFKIFISSCLYNKYDKRE